MLRASEIKEYIDLLEERWYSVAGLVATLLLSLGFEHVLIDGNIEWKIKAPILITTVIAVPVLWSWSRAVPRCSSSRIGIVVSLSYENAEVRERVRADFVQTLRELVTRGQSGPAFQLLEMPEHIAGKVNDLDDAQDLRRRSRAHLLIYGRVRLRGSDEEAKYIINMNGIVSHKPLPPRIQTVLQKDFSAIFPKEVKIGFESDILQFDVFSAWTECVAKYIVGVAFALSGLVDQAELLFRDVEREVKSASSASVETDINPAIERMSRSIPIRLVEISEFRAARYHRKWLATHDEEYLIKARDILSGLSQEFRERSGVFFLRGIVMFVSERDARKAIQHYLQAKKREVNNAVWHYNLAFLYGYDGDLKKAIRHYQAIEKLPPNVDALNQVEDFMDWMLSKEPGAVQLYYCRGFVEWRIRGDRETAIRDFERFLELCPEGAFEKELELAAKWIEKIRGES